MKRVLTYLKVMWWAKVLRDTQFVRTRLFIPGTYVCTDSITTKRFEIKRLSGVSEVYEVTHESMSLKDKWISSLDTRLLVLVSHDSKKTIAFIPEEGNLTYEGLVYAKTLLKI